jgi:hypothetical protein
MSRLPLAAFAALVAAGHAPAQPVTLVDTTFNATDWDFTVLSNTTGGTPTLFSGGGFRQVVITNPSVVGSNASTASIRLGFAYDPSAQGAIGSWSFTTTAQTGPNSNAVTGFFTFALRQGGTVYAGGGVIPSFIQPDTFTAPPPLPANYTRVSPAGPASPDFMAGGPIEFGYLASFSVTNSGGGSEGIIVSNFRLTINPVPEPSALALAGVAAAAWVARRRARGYGRLSL